MITADQKFSIGSRYQEKYSTAPLSSGGQDLLYTLILERFPIALNVTKLRKVAFSLKIRMKVASDVNPFLNLCNFSGSANRISHERNW